jgi:hypothetical protein
MKSTLIFIAAISIGVYSSPTARGTHVDIIRTPTVPEPDVERSVNGARLSNPLAASDVWACITVNTVEQNSGIGVAATQVQALANAQNNCGSDCGLKECVMGGCIAYAAGPQYVELYVAANFGSRQADQAAANSGALTTCRAHSSGCKQILSLCTSDAT